jgi:GWxTD domain-containing protein
MILCVFNLTAQFNEEMPRQAIHAPNPVMLEAITYRGDDSTTIDLYVQYRINSVFLFFAKSTAGQQETYEARGELVIEILDEKDATVTRDIKPLRIERSSLPPEGSLQIEEIQGVFTFHLKNRPYKISLELKDIESGKSSINRDTRIDARAFATSGPDISPAMFIERAPSDTIFSGVKEFIPMNRGGSVMIGQTVGCLFQVYSLDTSSNLQLTWKVKGKNEINEDFQQQFQGDHFLQFNGIPIVVENHGHISCRITSDSKYSKVILLSPPLERLETGKYYLTVNITQGTLQSTKEFTFYVVWPMKPRSLSDFKLAVDALRHIATEEEINQMTAFSTNKAKKAFREFWQRQNPDTTRAFNPKMAEYYRRVDESIRQFSTANETDGYRTDRGRIFILFGTPTTTNRLLKPNMVPTEIWTYETLKRRFIFNDQRNMGNYILVQTENY